MHCLNLTSTLPAVTPSSKPKSFISSTVLLPSLTFKSLHPASSSPTPSLIPPPSPRLSLSLGYRLLSGGGGAGICSAACCAWRSRRLSGGEKPAGFWWARGVISSFHRRPAKWKESRERKWWWRGLVVEWIGVRCKSSQRQHATVEKGGWRVGDGERQAGRKREREGERERERDGRFASLT